MGVEGKAMWSSDMFENIPQPREPWRPARGLVRRDEGHRTLYVFIAIEAFDNGGAACR